MVSHNLVLNSFPLRFVFSPLFVCKCVPGCAMASVALVDGQRHSPSSPRWRKVETRKKYVTQKIEKKREERMYLKNKKKKQQDLTDHCHNPKPFRSLILFCCWTCVQVSLELPLLFRTPSIHKPPALTELLRCDSITHRASYPSPLSLSLSLDRKGCSVRHGERERGREKSGTQIAYSQQKMTHNRRAHYGTHASHDFHGEQYRPDSFLD